MDRRQKKTRNAIFEAFITLLSRYSYAQITVGQIIEQADIGRATFYAHFETKDFLLKALCEELFAHIFEAESGTGGGRIFDCDTHDSVFLHLFQHLQRNDNHILQLLSGQNDALFLRYFKDSMTGLIQSHLSLFPAGRAEALPESLWIDHISSTFVETARWWVENGKKETPEQLTEYFYLLV